MTAFTDELRRRQDGIVVIFDSNDAFVWRGRRDDWPSNMLKNVVHKEGDYDVIVFHDSDTVWKGKYRVTPVRPQFEVKRLG